MVCRATFASPYRARPDRRSSRGASSAPPAPSPAARPGNRRSGWRGAIRPPPGVVSSSFSGAASPRTSPATICRASSRAPHNCGEEQLWLCSAPCGRPSPLRAKLTAFAQSVLSPTKASLKPDAASELGLTSPKERLGLEGASEGPTSVNDLLFVRYVLATVSKRSAGEDCLCEWVDSAAMARTRLQV